MMIEKIKAKVDVLQASRLLGAPLEPNSGGFCVCPFHAEKSGSFHLYDEGRRFHCFGCGAKGDALDYWQRSRGESPGDAVRSMAAALGIEGTTAPMLRKPKSTGQRVRVMEYPSNENSTDAEMVAAMLVALREGRMGRMLAWAGAKGIHPRTIQNEARQGRIGLVSGKLAWIYPHGVKVRGTLESSRGDRWLRGKAGGNVWGDGPVLDNPGVERVWLVEGESDRLRLMQYVEGPNDVVLAIPGASQAPDAMLSYRIGGHRDVVLCFDGDDAGRNATAAWTEAMTDANGVFDMQIPDGEDVCSLMEQGLEKKIAATRKKTLRVSQ
jgi:DNA primase